MKSVIQQIVELLGRHQRAGATRRFTELDLAEELGLNFDDVRIAVAMMGDQGLLAGRREGDAVVFELSEKGLAEYARYRRGA
ncbi:MAG: hypothetical protein Kow0092_10600 [Deferrisomatales bacterium]